MNRKDLKIGLIELYATVDGTLWGDRMKDLYSIVRLPSRATELLAANLRKNGFTSLRTFNPLYNRFGGKFHRKELEELAAMDVVGISAITRTHPPSAELACSLKELNPNIKVVFGGPHATACPEEALESCDVVVRREGDFTFPELAERVAADPLSPFLDDVEGISFKDDVGNVIHNPDRPYLTSEQLSDLPFPVYPKRVRKGIDYSVLVTSRGCPFRCDFCSVISHFGSHYRFLDVEATVAMVEQNLREVGKPIFFGDDNFHANPSRSKAVLNRILEKDLPMPEWGAQVRVEAAHDRELMRLMRRAGCTRLYVGLESVNEETLKAFNKHSSPEKNEEAIRIFNEHGFAVHGMFVLGSDEDTVETVRETVTFARKSMLSTAQFFCLTALPGTPMTRRYGEAGKILSRDWHLYDAHHVIVRPSRMAPYDLQRALDRANQQFYSWKEAFRHLMFARHNRVYNCVIRLLGNLLSRRVRFQMRPFRRRLRQLERWSDEMDSRYDRLVRSLGDTVQNLGKGLSQTAAPVRVSIEEFGRWLKVSLEKLPNEFVPYAQRYVRFKTEPVIRGYLPKEAVGTV